MGPKKGITVPQRVKEEEQDYGYIIDPDLVPLDITDKTIHLIQESLPELADLKQRKFETLGIQDENAKILSKDPQLAALFEEVSQKVDPSLAAKWIRREVLRIINLHKKKSSRGKTRRGYPSP